MTTAQHRRAIYILIALLALIATLGCSISSFGLERVSVGALRSESISVEREGAEQARATISMGAGELDVRRGTDALMAADFTYNVAAWRPEVSYSVADGQGRLTVRQPNTEQISIRGSTRQEWDIRLSDEIPLDLRIEAGAGRQELDLAGLQLTALDVKLGAGSATVDVSDNATLTRLDLDMGAGDVEVDLDGPWAQNTEVRIQGGVGEVTLRLPRDTGVRVTVTRGIGEVYTTNLRRDGSNVWVNDAYGESDVALDINIRAGVGRVTLDVRD